MGGGVGGGVGGAVGRGVGGGVGLGVAVGGGVDVGNGDGVGRWRAVAAVDAQAGVFDDAAWSNNAAPVIKSTAAPTMRRPRRSMPSRSLPRSRAVQRIQSVTAEEQIVNYRWPPTIK